MKILIREMRLLWHSLRDLLVQKMPDWCLVSRSGPEYKYAFLVHPRNIKDVYRKYPLFKIFPPRVLEFLLTHYWPVVLSHVTGLISRKTGQELDGFILTIPLTAKQMLEDRPLALKRIIQAVRLARNSGAKLIGLGGLTSSLTKGGLDLVDETDIHVTTGHAYTAFNVTQNLFKLATMFEVDKRRVLVAVVGAAGSVGSTSAKLIARKGFKNILLIDLERKKHQFPDLIREMKMLNPEVEVLTSHQIGQIREADFIIAATNAPEALIKSGDLKTGAVVIDDAQPSDVDPEALKREDVLVIEAGVVHTPGVNSHFNFNLKDKYDNFCCMAEVLILASLEHDDHYVINRATLEAVDEVSAQGEILGFRVGEFQNFNETIKSDKIMKIKEIIHARFEPQN